MAIVGAIDLALIMISGKVTNEMRGAIVMAEPLTDYVMNILERGGIKPLIKENLGASPQLEYWNDGTMG